MNNKYNSRITRVDNYIFTKEHTQIAKGIAILMMVYHHLFVIPGRLHYDYFSELNIFGIDLQTTIACFCKLCVCIYVFISGIGLYYSLHNENSIISMYKKVGSHILKFMLNFWIIGLCILPIGIYKGFFDFSVQTLIQNFFATNAKVMEWWFVCLYLQLIIIAPIIVCLMKLKNSKKYILPLLCSIGAYCICFLMVYYLPLPETVGYVVYSFLPQLIRFPLKYFPCYAVFIIGMLCAKFNFYKYMYICKSKKLFSVVLLIISICIRVLFSNTPDSMNIDVIVTPLFVFSITTLFINLKIKNIIFYFAKHSTNIWLTHTFWCYYFFQGIVMKPYYSILIYLWLIVLSLVSSYIINLIYIPISNLLFGKNHKLSYENYFYFLKKSKK